MSESQAIVDLVVAVRELTARLDAGLWPRWLSVEAAARYCSLGQKSVRNLIANGKLTPSRAVRGRVLIDRMQLDSVLAAECGRTLRKSRGIRRSEA
jgi:excisionase family DNA binding protein